MDKEEDVEPLQEDGVHGEEVGHHQGLGVSGTTFGHAKKGP
jgi:hypothetical protein